MRHRGHIDDLCDNDSRVVDGSDRGLTAGARTLDEDFHLTETCVESGLRGILGSHLGGIRGVLLGTSEAALTG